MRWLGPWSASSGAQSSPSATPPPRRTAVDDARSRRLFGDDVLKAGPRKYGEDAVVQGQERQIAAGIVRHGRAVDTLEEERERRERDDLYEDQERQRREQLAEPDRAAVAGRQDERVEQALVPLGRERPRQRQQRGEEHRDPQEALGRLALLVGKREAEDDQGADHERRHRRHGLAPPQLEQEVLARQRHRVGEVRHASASIAVAFRASRPGSCVATTSVRPSRGSASMVSSTATPAASRALKGSSSSSRSGSCSSTRQSA